MNISFSRSKLQKTFNSEKELIREYGPDQARVIMRRMSVLRAAASLEEVPRFPPERHHELTGDMQGMFAVDLKHPYRLLFVPSHDPVPRTDDNSIDLRNVTAIKILEIKDYH